MWLMTDAVRMRDPIAMMMRLKRGDGVILRHTDGDELRRLAGRMVPLCRRSGVTCLIAGDWRLAAQCKAHGLHLPERSARVGAGAPAFLWRRQSGRLMTVSAHGGAALKRGERLGADAVLLAPVFPTASHPDARILGSTRFAAHVRRVHCPVIALGGVTARTQRRLAISGAYGVAGISWIVDDIRT
jgi:thiamine-phosphate pyrophosphorylase